MGKMALVVGFAGQDGYYLSESLSRHGYEVWGLERKGLCSPVDSLPETFDMNDGNAWIRLMGKVSFDEVYYLAACHHSAENRNKAVGLEVWKQSWSTHVEGWVACLEALRKKCPSCRAFYAASSLVFGHPEQSPQDEQTPFRPITIYGITKAAGVSAALHYRQCHGLYTSAGLLYNHESPRRKESFVSQKIVRGLMRVKRGEQEALSLARLDAVVDWGYAPDYAEAMRQILQMEIPDDYVIATGKPHSVADFTREACNYLGLDMLQVVREAPAPTSNINGPLLVGNPAKLQRDTGWVPTISFKEMVQKLIDAAE